MELAIELRNLTRYPDLHAAARRKTRRARTLIHQAQPTAAAGCWWQVLLDGHC